MDPLFNAHESGNSRERCTSDPLKQLAPAHGAEKGGRICRDEDDKGVEVSGRNRDTYQNQEKVTRREWHRDSELFKHDQTTNGGNESVTRNTKQSGDAFVHAATVGAISHDHIGLDRPIVGVSPEGAGRSAARFRELIAARKQETEKWDNRADCGQRTK